jgi:hypothetical protein
MYSKYMMIYTIYTYIRENNFYYVNKWLKLRCTLQFKIMNKCVINGQD